MPHGQSKRGWKKFFARHGRRTGTNPGSKVTVMCKVLGGNKIRGNECSVLVMMIFCKGWHSEWKGDALRIGG
jgi:hypothetical protein